MIHIANERARENSWPWFMPLGAAGLVVVGLIAAVHQRHPYWDRVDAPFGYSMLAVSIAAAVIFLPYAVDTVGALTRKEKAAGLQEGNFGLPLWLFPIPIAAGVAYLSFHPVDTDFTAFVLVFAAAEQAARAGQRRLLGVWATALGCAAMLSAEIFGPYEGSFIWVIGISFGWFGGFMVGELDGRKRALEEAQAGLAEKAAADERSRIAREVHDVIAHSLSVTMLHVSAARMALQRDRTADALDALKEAEKQGRNSLSEVRRTVGLLGPDESATAAPQPGVLDLPKLATDFRTAGLDVRMDIAADPDNLPASAGLNIYRIIQEALTNAVKHAPGSPVDVQLKLSEDAVYIRVHNARVNGTTPNTLGKGLGLRGMAERAALLGGELETDTSDGWTVTVSAPRPT